MSEMTPKTRILNAINGLETDRVPWSPFLAYYWEHLPPEERSCGKLEYLKKMGADPLLRGVGKAYDISYENCDITVKQNGNKKYTTYSTRVGSITTEHTLSSTARTWFLTGHPVCNEEDFKVLQYITENTVVTECLDVFEKEHKQIGEDALMMPVVGIRQKTAFQALVEHWCGTVDLTYALQDFPEVVEECLAAMQAKDKETVDIWVKSSAETLLFYEDSSTTNISPAMFAQYTAPEINEWGRLIHANGKKLIHHACGHLKDLIPLMCKTEIDAIESISPPPTGNIEIRDAVKLMPEHIGIIGGIEPTLFANSSLEELEKCVFDLISLSKSKKRFVLANSDSCPPDVAYEKFLLVSKLVRKTRM